MAVVPTTGGQGQTPFSGSQRRDIAPVPPPAGGGLRFPPSPQPGGVPGVGGGGGGMGGQLTAGLNAIADRKARQQALTAQIDQREKERVQAKRDAKAQRKSLEMAGLSRLDEMGDAALMTIALKTMDLPPGQYTTPDEVALFGNAIATQERSNALQAGRLTLRAGNIERVREGQSPLTSEEQDVELRQYVEDRLRGVPELIIDEDGRINTDGIRNGRDVLNTRNGLYSMIWNFHNAGVDQRQMEDIANRANTAFIDSRKRIWSLSRGIMGMDVGDDSSGGAAAGLERNMNVIRSVLPEINATMSRQQIRTILAKRYRENGMVNNWASAAQLVMESAEKGERGQVKGVLIPELTEALGLSLTQMGRYLGRVVRGDQSAPDEWTIQLGGLDADGKPKEGTLLSSIDPKDIQAIFPTLLSETEQKKLALVIDTYSPVLTMISASNTFGAYIQKDQISDFMSDIALFRGLPGEALDAMLAQIAAKYADDPRNVEIQDAIVQEASIFARSLSALEALPVQKPVGPVQPAPQGGSP